MMHGELGSLLLIGIVAALWVWSVRGREIIDRVSNRICTEVGVQRLDESVALRRLRPGPPGRRFALERIYGFEYSITGGDRCSAEICLIENAAAWARLDHPGGAIHINLTRGSAPPIP